MKNIFKKFLCAAMFAVTSVCAGSFVGAINYTIPITFSVGENTDFVVEKGREYELLFDDGSTVKVAADQISYKAEEPGLPADEIIALKKREKKAYHSRIYSDDSIRDVSMRRRVMSRGVWRAEPERVEYEPEDEGCVVKNYTVKVSFDMDDSTIPEFMKPMLNSEDLPVPGTHIGPSRSLGNASYRDPGYVDGTLSDGKGHVVPCRVYYIENYLGK